MACRKKYPESWPARRFTSVTFGATPAMPMPLIGAPIVDATCVPCPSSSTFGGSTHDGTSHGPSISSPFASVGMSVVKLRLSSLEKFGAMSGCVPSTPVSMIPTSTCLLPRSTRYEPSVVAWICCMSHWRSASGSAFGPLPGWDRRCSVSAFASFCVERVAAGLLDRIAVDGSPRAGGGNAADDRVLRDAFDAVTGREVRRERSVARTHGRDTDFGVLLDDLAAGRGDRSSGGIGRAFAVDDDVLGLAVLGGLLILGRRRGGCRDDEREDGCEWEQESPHEFPLRA